MPSPSDPAIQDIEDFYNFTKEWHRLINEKINQAIDTDDTITLRGPTEEDTLVISDQEHLTYVRLGLIIASTIVKPFPFYENQEEQIKD